MTKLNPIKATPYSAYSREAWWYENTRSVSVFVQGDDNRVYACKIQRAKLADWVKRTEPKK